MRRDAFASQASRNAAGELGKPPFGSRIPASRGVEDPRRCFGIASGPSPAEKPGYGIVWVSYVRFYPLVSVGAGQPVETRLEICDKIARILEPGMDPQAGAGRRPRGGGAASVRVGADHQAFEAAPARPHAE